MKYSSNSVYSQIYAQLATSLSPFANGSHASPLLLHHTVFGNLARKRKEQGITKLEVNERE